MKKKIDKSTDSVSSRAPGQEENETVIAGNYPAGETAGRAVAGDDGSAEDKTILAGELVDDDKTVLTADIVVDEKTVLAGDADHDGQTVLAGAPVDGDKTQLSADYQPLEDTATLGANETPNESRTRQAEKAQSATVLGKTAAGGAARAVSGNNERIVRDRFVILERLGKGGMGEVYKARDLRKEEAEDDNPYVAIKFLGEAFSQHPRALISLQREAKRSQQLAHPNVLTVYDFDRDGDRVYMTMEYLNGAPLSGWDSIEFLEGREPNSFSLIEDIATGLQYAHEHGVVHSDLKPDNVFITVDGRVKILDFGIARIMDSALEKDSFDAGELGALTMRYASLEMLQGGTDPHPSDDIYALGLMAFQLVAGVHPYEGKNAQDAKKLGITPPPLKGLKRYQRKAIENAIVLEREKRTQSAELFLRRFTGTKTRNQVLLAAVFILILSSGYFAYEASLREGPSVPFEQLSPTVQQEFMRNIDLGKKSSAIDDWDGASRYYIAAYDLHPRNPVAEEGLESLALHLVDVATSLESKRQKQYLLVMLKGYSSNEYLASHEALSAERLRLEGELGEQRTETR